MAELIGSVASFNHASLGPVVSDITPFHSRAVPSISVHDYLARIAKFVCLENDSLLAVLVYLDRITRNHLHRPALAVSPYNIHRLLITAIVVAHKFNSDIFFNNARYSKVGGIPLIEMNQLELELLFLIKFDLKVDHDQLQQIGNWLMTCPRVDSCESQKTPYSGQPVCVLEAYYRSLEVAAKQAELCHIHYPTPLMDPTPVRGTSSVSFLDLNGTMVTTTTKAATTGPVPSIAAFQHPIPTSIHKPLYHYQQQHPQQQQQQHYHQSKHPHQNNYPYAPQQATPSSVDTSSSLVFNGSSSFVAPSCSSATSTLCLGFGNSSEIDQSSWRVANAFSPASPENQMMGRSLVGTSNDSLKRRNFPSIGFPINADSSLTIVPTEQDTATSGVFVIDND
ncbi:cyclin-like protein interacting with PHO85 [Coemansia sp. RSA 485]|nr:cyclin-like protein interacting with PHO85 [Coemansia sp. RSA 485]